MALLVTPNSVTCSLISSSSSLLSSSSSITAIPIVTMVPKSLAWVRLQTPYIAAKPRSVTAKASSESGEEVESLSVSSSESKEVSVSIENMPLESKVKERTEQQERMRLAKKIRLRRKRLVRKRKLRKKGRWPPSKMKKLKNV